MSEISAGAIPVDQFQAAAAPAQAPVQDNSAPPPGAIPIDQFQSVQDVYGTPGQQILGGIEAAGKGALGPIATGFEKRLSEVGVPGLSPQAQAGREAAAPVTHGAIEAAALIGSSFLDFGLGAGLNATGHAAEAATGLGRAGSGLASKIAGKAAGSAAEMAAFQAQDEVSKQINNPQFTADALGSAAINIGLSGIIGGVVGGGLGAVSPLWQQMVGDKADAYLNLLQNKKQGIGLPVEPHFQAFLDTAEKAGTPVAPEIKAIFSESPTLQNMFQSLRESGSSAADALNQTIEATKEGAQKQITDTLGANGPSAFEAGAKAKTDIQAKMDQLNDNVKNAYSKVSDVNNVLVKDEDKIKFGEKLLEDGSNFGAAGGPGEALFTYYKDRLQSQNTIGQLDKLVTEIGSSANEAKIAGNFEKARALNDIKQSIAGPDGFIDKQIDKAIDDIQSGDDPAIAAGLKADRRAAKGQYRDFVNTVGDIAGAAKLGKIHSYGQITEALEKIPNEKLADRLFSKDNFRGLSKLKNDYPEIFDTLASRYKTELVESSSKSGTLNHNTLLNKINDLSKETKSLVFKPEELQTIESASDAIKKLNIRKNPSGTAGTLLKNITGLVSGEAAVVGALTHGPLGAVVGLVGSQLGKLFGHTVPNNVRLALLKFLGSNEPVNAGALKSALDYIELVAKGNKTLSNSVNNVFKSSVEVINSKMLPDDKSRDKLKKTLAAANADPDSMMKVGGNLGHYMPEHATAAGMMAASAVSYLNSLNPPQTPGAPLDVAPAPNKLQEYKYNRALDIAQQPLIVLKHVDDGTLTSQDVQTLQAVNPGLHSNMVNKLTEQLIAEKAKGTEIPYYKRRGLSMLIGSPIDSTMTPMAAQSIMHSQMPQAMPQPQSGPQKQRAVSGKALSQIDKVNSMFTTPDQRREMTKKA